MAGDVQIYFRNPRGPSQRRCDGNTNGRLRQYFLRARTSITGRNGNSMRSHRS